MAARTRPGTCISADFMGRASTATMPSMRARSAAIDSGARGSREHVGEARALVVAGLGDDQRLLRGERHDGDRTPHTTSKAIARTCIHMRARSRRSLR
jgi:hypothetical protein